MSETANSVVAVSSTEVVVVTGVGVSVPKQPTPLTSASGAGLQPQSNRSAVVAPGVSDDSAAGYAVGSYWIDTALDNYYVLLDATPGAAVWEELGAGGGHAPWVEDEFTATLGQITFILSAAPTDANSFSLHVNGVLYDDVADYTISGVTVTWLNTGVVMAAGDVVHARYC